MILDLGVFHYLSVLLCCEWVGFEWFRQPTTLNRKKMRLELTGKLEGGGAMGGGRRGGWMSRLENATEQRRYLN